MLHIPVLRAGVPYRSLDTVQLADVVTGEPLVEVSQANRGLIAKDLYEGSGSRRALSALSVAELIEICGRAAKLFVESSLPLDPDSGQMQTHEEYILQLSATTGMPQSFCRANAKKVCFVLANMERMLGGLMRGLDPAVLDAGYVNEQGAVLSFVADTDFLGAVLPSNSPGVHSLWLPAIPLKMPLVLKPGRAEPWTPFRLIQALISAGCPKEAFFYYPTGRSGAGEILSRTGRSMLFGGASTVASWADDPKIQLHGPGWSKILLGDDTAAQWRDYLDVFESSVAVNGGRSCLNTSSIWTPAHGRELAEGLADRLGRIGACSLDDPEARIAAFTDARVAQAVADYIEEQVRAIPGAVDLTAERRGAGPLVEKDGLSFLRPTVIWCEDSSHPLASCEFLFPFVSVCQAPQSEVLERIGSTLVGTVISEDEAFLAEVVEARNIDRLNLGPVPTSQISWDQPHEGNLFEHLYHQRAFQSRIAS